MRHHLAARARFRSFPWVRLSYLLLGLALIATLLGVWLRRSLDHPRVRFSHDELVSWTGGSRFVERSAPYAHVLVDTARSGRVSSAAAASMAVAPDLRGYAGPLNIFVDVGHHGRLRHVRLLASRETPSYVVGLGRWLESLVGRRLDRPLRLRRITEERGHDPDAVDAITGATISSEAALAAVKRTGAALCRDAHGLHLSHDADKPAYVWLRQLGRAGVIYLLLALLLVVPISRWGSARLRTVLLAFNVVVAGLWLNIQLSPVDIARLVALELPSPSHLQLWLLVFGVLVLTALFGSLYCGYLCPFGAAQELLGRLGFARRLHPRVDAAARYLKYVLLTALVVACAITASDRLLAADPLRYRLGLDAHGWPLLLLMLIGIASLFIFRPWCRYLCPVGAAVNLGNKLSVARRWLRPRHYTACDLGVRGQLDVDCLQCDRCVVRTVLPRTTDTRRDRRFVVWLALVLLTLGAVLYRSSPPATVADIHRGKPRQVDVDRLLKRIELRQLSRQRARHYRRADGGTPSTD